MTFVRGEHIDPSPCLESNYREMVVFFGTSIRVPPKAEDRPNPPSCRTGSHHGDGIDPTLTIFDTCQLSHIPRHINYNVVNCIVCPNLHRFMKTIENPRW